MTYLNGDIYQGDWLEGFMNGKGKISYARGDIYEGEWSNG